MTLTPGTRLGVYEILGQIGAGGMGEVYRATDSHLKRSVAIKVLPAAMAADADRLARFQREAEVLAALNHPNIAAIYGLEKTPDLAAFVMELVEGEDLAAHISRGPISLTESLPIVRQIADALEAAHEQGIIHRDLKPANIKVRADGTVKLLDFGLAKIASTAATGKSGGVEKSAATMTSPAMTHVGVILGTAAYMSPEQAKGRAVDKRADIWAFGVVLFEMLTGRPLFTGDSVAETIGLVATRDPDWTALPATTPAPVRRLLARCLTRDPKERLRDIGEARIALADPIHDAGTTARPAALPRRMNAISISFAVTAALLAAVAGYLALRPAPAVAPIRLDMADGTRAGQSALSAPSVSPDGMTVAVAIRTGKENAIWIRPLAAGAAYPVAGTEGAIAPIWSPDGSEIGFVVDGGPRAQIRKVPVGGGRAQTLGEVPYALHGAWSKDGVIVVSQSGGSPADQVLFRLPATGGTPTKANDVRGSRWPSFLPGGRDFLFTLVSSNADEAGIYVGALDSTDKTRLTSVVSSAQYAGGHLFYVKDQAVVAQPFDLDARRLTGNPVPIFDNIEFTAPIYRGAFSVTGTTFAARSRSGPPLRQFSWMSRSGTPGGTLGEPGDFAQPDLSPDENILAFIREDPAGGPSALWTLDLQRNVFSQLRPETAAVRFSTGGQRFAYITLNDVRLAPIAGGDETVLLSTGAVRSRTVTLPGTVHGWSADDRYVAIQIGPRSQIFEIAAPAQPLELGLRGEIAFSPAGGWLAYRETGGGSEQRPVFVEPFTGKPLTGAGRVQVSSGGGRRPRWRQDGRELYYISSNDEMMVTTVVPGQPLTLGKPAPLFKVPTGTTAFDVSNDGQRFLLMTTVTIVTTPPTSVVLNWRALLK